MHIILLFFRRFNHLNKIFVQINSMTLFKILPGGKRILG
ncbi:hypothetical protein ABEDC_0045 [Acinetobacter lwoffii]|nr:hypothetical protein ABEDC_0045 [Acinetobacter lwoffii]